LKPFRVVYDAPGDGSPPARGRGLKRAGGRDHQEGSQSPPARGRGLKLRLGQPLPRRMVVAPYAGAWIETINGRCMVGMIYRRPLRGGVDLATWAQYSGNTREKRSRLNLLANRHQRGFPALQSRNHVSPYQSPCLKIHLQNTTCLFIATANKYRKVT